MTVRRSDLQEAFFVPGTQAFRVFGYGTTDPLEEVLAQDYFGAASGLLQPGDLIYLRAQAAADDRSPAAGVDTVHLTLLMVRSGPRGSAAVRLVQDFGRSDEPAAVKPTSQPALPAAAASTPPPKRGRGRPPCSRSQKSTRLAREQTPKINPQQHEAGNDLLN